MMGARAVKNSLDSTPKAVKITVDIRAKEPKKPFIMRLLLK